eukprot:TRINITY_DN1063_c0_g1_i1.p2 TRINITY_DN1063_c0_g1~~TRINITY_DN1063_c0_g1_i1.p2  ORF type:complete len:129 (+),score=43.77 TRINITY_DN1063_c0_g1_i1:344-730(+)
MIAAIQALKARGLKVAAVTNNWAPTNATANDVLEHGTAMLRALFDVFVESYKVGVRKPDPKIWAIALTALGVAPEEAVFLDDIGLNVKAARALGMKTIRVASAAQALSELEAVLGFALGPAALATPKL